MLLWLSNIFWPWPGRVGSSTVLLTSLTLWFVQALHSVEVTRSIATPEELVRCTKPITVATAKAVAAGNSCKQEDIIVAANMGRKAISDMLTISKVRYIIYMHNTNTDWRRMSYVFWKFGQNDVHSLNFYYNNSYNILWYLKADAPSCLEIWQLLAWLEEGLVVSRWRKKGESTSPLDISCYPTVVKHVST